MKCGAGKWKEKKNRRQISLSTEIKYEYMKLKPMRHLWRGRMVGLILCLGLLSCSGDYYGKGEEGGQGLLALKVGTSGGTALTDSPSGDMRLLLSRRGGADDGKFSYEIYGINRTGTTLTSAIRTGNWYLTMVSPQGAALSNPAAGRLMSGQTMYRYSPSVVSGKSTFAHEFFFGRVSLPEVREDQTVTVNPANVARNVAKVRVYVESVRNIDPAREQNIRLYKVPSRLDWEGKLLPSKTNPDTLALPLQGKLNFTSRGDGTFRSDTMVFIIPAHRGTDFWNADGTLNPNPSDLTTLRMDVGIGFRDGIGTLVQLRKTLPVVVRCNQILDVKLILNVLDMSLECNVTTLPVWEEVVSDDPNLH